MTPATFLSYPVNRLCLSGYTEINYRIEEKWTKHIPIRSSKTCLRVDIRQKELGNLPLYLHLVPHLNPLGSLTITAPNKVLEVPVALIPPAHIHVYRELNDSDGYEVVCLIPLGNRHDQLNIGEIHRSLWEAMPESSREDESAIYRYYYAELMLHFHVIIFDRALLPTEKPYHYPSVDDLLKAYPA